MAAESIPIMAEERAVYSARGTSVVSADAETKSGERVPAAQAVLWMGGARIPDIYLAKLPCAHRLKPTQLRLLVAVLLHSWGARHPEWAIDEHGRPPSIAEWGRYMGGWSASQFITVRRELERLGVITFVDDNNTQIAIQPPALWDPDVFLHNPGRPGAGAKPRASGGLYTGDIHATIAHLMADGALSGRWSSRPTANDWRVLRQITFERDDYTCQYCERRTHALHCDHLVPLAQGGTNHPDNLVTACRTCNLTKRGISPEEWLALLRQRKAGRS